MKEQLHRIGVSAPEYRFCIQASDARKALKLIAAGADFGGKGSAVLVVSTAITELTEARTHIDTLERLVATLADEIATRRDKETACVLCCGAGAYNYTQHEGGVWHSGRKVCGRCSGTGRRQA